MKLKEDVLLNNLCNHFIDLREIDDDSIIVDAGACQGEFIRALRMSEQGKNCRILAIECCEDNIKKLKEENYQNVILCNKALVGENFGNQVTFSQVIDKRGWGNIFRRDCRGERTKEYEVSTLRINGIFSALSIEQIDFLKMDIEGAEGDVLRTMTEETATKIAQMSMEVHGWGRLTVSGVIQKLEDLGFAAIEKRAYEVYGRRL